MPTVTIRDLPKETLDALKLRASAKHRSLNGEILCIFDYAVSAKSEFDIIRENRARKQREALKHIFSKWEDDRNTEEIIRDIESSRTSFHNPIIPFPLP